ncbi:adenosine deaminase family protein [Ideonella sp.]|uniref:adenosine deaminase family protein n=1 Tax=Ideonella sp. TaxID=1929293 RepID=UPI002B49D9E4|nr:adenosine deaminase family protein [Ideonella sp.]HJV70816.1 adenosine deaminase family protein [Ideonella sp.]
MLDDAESLRRLPKVLLHEHLDGGLSPATLWRLLHARGLPVPAADEAGLAAWFEARAHAGSLVEYLKGFGLTVAAMAEPAAMEQVAFEAAEQARHQGCVLAEFRMAPLLLESDAVPAEAAVEALLAGLERSALPCGLILCAMREEPAARSERVVQLALRYRDDGVIGFDLAGAELGHPPGEHGDALALAREHGLPITLHAGEADAAERVLEAAALGARRIGHGVHLSDWLRMPGGRERLAEVRARGLHLEMCPSSNLHTGAVASLAEHPIGALWRAGLSLSYHTDNPLMSCTTMSAEAAILLAQQGLARADLLAMAVQAAEHSFLPAAVRAQALARLREATAHVSG